MSTVQPQAVFLKDYQVPDFIIEKTSLVFSLRDQFTKVTSTLLVKRNTASENKDTPLVLSGQELILRSISVNGRDLTEDEYHVDAESLRVVVPDECIVMVVTEIKPKENTSLEGLYQSSNMYCTQCEAEGFRKITYYLDRPDAMSEFSTKIIADKTKYPVLLSNGNLINSGELDDNQHWAQWHDPFKKPSYLFALVAGNLQHIEDTFVTTSGRNVVLRIYVEKKDIDKCDYAMASLKRAMKWDEEMYGREYDLDIFMIVAVDDFNMGAMENKGLNIFNTSCVLAKPETTTDQGFQRVEAVIAHEYFHNWSGNRVTCRDWFQLSLKEGFTVFRDAEFSSDMGSRDVKRIEDVILLRTLQFAEDAGPMAHPVQPASFIEISNFYTLTIYEKGAEIVRMLHTLLGDEKFREGSDLYFKKYDGQAVTINDFVDSMAAASGRDLTQFMHWYTQAGTPVLTITDEYDKNTQTYQLTVKQSCPDTPEATQAEKLPYHIPLALGLVGESGGLCLHIEGDDLTHTTGNSSTTHQVIEITQAVEKFTFTQVLEKPVPSLLRNFSAPVRLAIHRTREDYLRLLCFDEDAFSRWDAAQQLAVSIIQELMLAYQQKQVIEVDTCLQEGLKQVLLDDDLDKAMIALILTLPSEAYLAEISEVIDVDAIIYARNQLSLSIARGLCVELKECYQLLAEVKPYAPTADEVAKRSLKNTALYYLMLLDDNDVFEQCYKQFTSSNNMTDSLSALKNMIHSTLDSADKYKDMMLAEFYQRWQQEMLVVNQWLMVQALTPLESALEHVRVLITHDSFSITNPNKVRSLIGAFSQNMRAFHQKSGAGYEFLADQVISLNQLNPQVAARMLTPLTRWRKYDESRQQKMRHELLRIQATPNLSKDVFEVLSKSL